MKIDRLSVWDYFILVSRILLAGIFLSYGFSKLSSNQFGISEAEKLLPLKELNTFKLAWYLFDHEPYKSFIGISQIVCGLMLIYNRTVLLGAILFLPIAINILIFDITFLKWPNFYYRLSTYLLLDFLILFHYKDRIISSIKILTNKLTPQFRFSLWAYLILPILAFILEFALAMPKIIYNLIIDPHIVIAGFKNFIHKF